MLSIRFTTLRWMADAESRTHNWAVPTEQRSENRLVQELFRCVCWLWFSMETTGRAGAAG